MTTSEKITAAQVLAVLEVSVQDLPMQVAQLVVDATEYSTAEDVVNIIAEAAVQLGIIEDVEDTGPEALVREQVEELASGGYTLRTGYVKVVYAGKAGDVYDLPRYLAEQAAGDESSTDYGRLVFSAHGWHAGKLKPGAELGTMCMGSEVPGGEKHYFVGTPFHEHMLHVVAGTPLEAAQKAADPGHGFDMQAGEYRVYEAQDMEAVNIITAGHFELDDNGEEVGEEKPEAGTLGAVDTAF